MHTPLIILLLVISFGSLIGQNKPLATTITVLGRENSIEKANGYGIIVFFEENPNKCDPVKGFVPLEEQFKHFNEAAKARGIDVTAGVEETPNLKINHPHKRWKFEHPSIDVILELKEICKQQLLTAEKLYYNLPPSTLESQDEKAAAAFHDANRKAANYAQSLGKKVVKVINIDDDTEFASMESLWDKFSPQYNYDYDKFMEVFEMLSQLTSRYNYTEDGSAPLKSSSYTLLVTFEIE